MTEILSKTIHYKELDSQRVDSYLSALFSDVSRSSVQNAIDTWEILVNDEKVDKKYRLKTGDIIRVNIKQKSINIVPEDIPLDILHEQEDFLVLNKQPWISVHPSDTERTGTIVHGLLHKYPDVFSIAHTERPGIVHRLDKDTSGLLLVAKTDIGMKHLQDIFQNRLIKKYYIALVFGVFEEKKWDITSMIGRDPNNRIKMTTKHPLNPKSAHTSFEVLKEFQGKFSLVKVQLHTGRTHQIRVHLSAIGHPIVGDVVYGDVYYNARSEEFWVKRQMLHAKELFFEYNNQKKSFIADIPSDIEAVLQKIGEEK